MRGNKDIVNKNEYLWADYMVVGFGLSLIATLIDYAHDSYLQAILFLAFFVITGLRENCKELLSYLRRFPIFFAAILIWEVYFAFFRKTDPITYRLPIAVSAMFVGGLIIAGHYDQFLEKSLNMVFNFIGISAVFGLWWYLKGYSGVARYFQTANDYFQTYYYRLSSFYIQPMPAATAFLALVVYLLLFESNKYIKTIGVILGLSAIWFTTTRSAMLLVVAMPLFWMLVSVARGNIILADVKKTCKSNAKYIIGVIALLCLFAVVFRHKIINSISIFLYRMGGISYKGGEIGYRLDAWIYIIKEYLNGTVSEEFIGKGLLKGYYFLASPDGLLSKYTIYAGPIESTFLTILFDFGIVGFVMYFAVLIHVIIYICKGKNELKRKVGFILLSMIAMSSLFDMVYWNNNAFMLFTLMGIYFGLPSDSVEENDNNHCCQSSA